VGFRSVAREPSWSVASRTRAAQRRTVMIHPDILSLQLYKSVSW
jgi:hypothetical protein